ncbi:O-unit flippase-like protein [Aquitalea sp. USM4]|uniref:O-unit flippase-like protein n=1 Tax=Aquitalea sp. USM4 TaxID=1590041 RepID=UPI001038CF4C|nr:O-unit flippase-like protein [Aquitalea sp. USM4]QBJ78421.1 hypothetical protein DKK66_10190 [Aquitalea sp. USM4]
MKKDIYWGYASQILQYGSALFVLPILLRKLNSNELGIWYVFMTISNLVNMLDMGFTPALTRSISYVMAGAQTLQEQGHPEYIQDSKIEFRLLSGIISTSNKIFSLIASIALPLLILIGTPYIQHITDTIDSGNDTTTSWLLFSAAIAINLYNKRYIPILHGRGLFSRFYKCTAISNITFILAASTLLTFNFKLIGISIGFLSSAIIGNLLLSKSTYDKEFKNKIQNLNVTKKESNNIFKSIWPNSWRLGLVVIGSFLILRANTLLSSNYLGLKTTASFGLTNQVFTVLQSIALVYFGIQQQYISRLRVSSQREALLSTIEDSISRTLIIFIAGTVLFISTGNLILYIIDSGTHFLPLPALILMGVMYILELNHSLAAGIILTGNKVPYVKPALISGILIFTISLAGLNFGGGIYWLITTQLLIQLLYNNWKWPHIIAKEFHTDYPTILINGLKRFSQIAYKIK